MTHAREGKEERSGPYDGFWRPPFEPGHLLSVRHGTRSPRMVNPIAQRLVDNLLADDDLAYLRAPRFEFAVAAWGRAEAQVRMLEDYIEKLSSFEDSLMDVETSESTEDHKGGHSKRVSTTKKRQSAAAQLDRAERHAANCRSKLGLDPLARARLGRDVASARVDMASLLSKLNADQQSSQEDEQ